MLSVMTSVTAYVPVAARTLSGCEPLICSFRLYSADMLVCIGRCALLSLPFADVNGGADSGFDCQVFAWHAESLQVSVPLRRVLRPCAPLRGLRGGGVVLTPEKKCNTPPGNDRQGRGGYGCYARCLQIWGRAIALRGGGSFAAAPPIYHHVSTR